MEFIADQPLISALKSSVRASTTPRNRLQEIFAIDCDGLGTVAKKSRF